MADEINSNFTPERPKGTIRDIWAVTIILVLAILVGGGVWYWYYQTSTDDSVGITTLNRPSLSPSESPVSSVSTPPANTKTYTSTSTYLPKFSFQYPVDWKVLKNDFSYYRGGYTDEKTGIEIYDSNLEFTKFTSEKENILETLHLKINIYKKPGTTNINDAFQTVNGGVREFNDYIANPIKNDDITVGGVKTKKYLLPGGAVGDSPDFNFIAFMKNDTYFEFSLDDPNNEWEHDLGAKSGFDQIVSTFKFL